MNLQPGYDLSHGLALGAVWESYALKFPHGASTHHPTSRMEILEGPVSSFRTNNFDEAIYDYGEGYAFRVRIEFDTNVVSISVASENPDKSKHICKDVSEKYPELEVSNNQITSCFWAFSSHGPQEFSRTLSAEPWESIENNYSQDAKNGINYLLGEDFSPGLGGQLLLWHGPPGTGKTTAIRSLLSEWREWARLHYITDPEKFFGTQADYMLRVLLETAGEDDGIWRVIVLEDASELLGVEAKNESGQALSRFLNAVDGMIGQGLRILVLATTNEEVVKWHPAVRRYGRAASQIEFSALSEEEANDWRMERGLELSEGSTILADLYGELTGTSQTENESSPAVGFH